MGGRTRRRADRLRIRQVPRPPAECRRQRDQARPGEMHRGSGRELARRLIAAQIGGARGLAPVPRTLQACRRGERSASGPRLIPRTARHQHPTARRHPRTARRHPRQAQVAQRPPAKRAQRRQARHRLSTPPGCGSPLPGCPVGCGGTSLPGSPRLSFPRSPQWKRSARCGWATLPPPRESHPPH